MLRKKISLMGLELDDYSFPEAMKIIESFLGDTALSTVLSVNTEKLLCADEDAVVKEVLSAADYTVITDQALFAEVSGSAAERRFEVEDGRFLPMFLSHMYRADRSFFLVSTSQETLSEMHRLMTEQFSHARIVGECVIPSDPGTYESCVNAINILMPDVILSSMASPQEERFLHACRSKLCARIWYSAGVSSMDAAEGFSLVRQLRRLKDRSLFRSRLRRQKAEK